MLEKRSDKCSHGQYYSQSVISFSNDQMSRHFQRGIVTSFHLLWLHFVFCKVERECWSMKRVSDKSFSLTRWHIREQCRTKLEAKRHCIKLKSLCCFKQPENACPLHIFSLKPNMPKVIMHDKCQLATKNLIRTQTDWVYVRSYKREVKCCPLWWRLKKQNSGLLKSNLISVTKTNNWPYRSQEPLGLQEE